MDEGRIRTTLDGLGVSLVWDDDLPLQRADLPRQRVQRASLYVQHLTAARDFFVDELAKAAPGGLGSDYAFVAPALNAKDFLTPLAQMLDRYTGVGVEAALPAGGNQTYEQLFKEIIVPDDQTYEANRTTFLDQTYPIVGHALRTITANFQRNIKEACTRVLRDRATIRRCFAPDYFMLAIDALTGIRSSASDFHKGGRQVLFLTFSIVHIERFPVRDTLRLVYKPSDLEIDCRLVGDSNAVNAALGTQFMKKSLTEIVNAAIEQRRAGDPNCGLELLPTYRIIPMATVGGQAEGLAPVREAYGYIEFLSHELTGTTLGVDNYYPFGASDYVIFRSQAEVPVVRRFYRQMGQWCAIAATYSLWDLHFENVRVRNYSGYLIDLEVALTAPTQDLRETMLIEGSDGNAGGITGYEFQDPDGFYWVVSRDGRFLDRENYSRGRQNRLKAYRPSLKVVPVEPYWLLEGLEKGLSLLAALEGGTDLPQWRRDLIDRGVLVRVLPLTTNEWQQMRDRIFFHPDGLGQQLAGRIQATLLDELTARFEVYARQPTPEPDFVVAQPQFAEADLTGLDIPVFYHRIGTSDIVDSTGNVVTVPDQVTVKDEGGGGTRQVATNVARATFFGSPPTEKYVRTQVEALLTPNGAGQRFKMLQDNVLKALELQTAPTGPAGQLIP